MAHMDPRAWRARRATEKSGEGRTLAEIFSHLHNNRLVWLEKSAPYLRRPSRLDPARCTIKQACAALRKSAAACLEMLKEALSEHTIRFYMNGIGFSMKHKWVVGEELRWCWLELGGAALMLQASSDEGGRGHYSAKCDALVQGNTTADHVFCVKVR
jgi:hypothetical protein